MGTAGGVSRLLRDRRTNTVLSWCVVGVVAAGCLATVAANQLLWAGFAATVVVLALAPPVAFRDASVMLPWEVLVLVAVPVLGRSLAPQVGTPPVVGRIATYLGVAALALVVAVELDVFTRVEMVEWVAVCFVVVTTMAAAGAWAVVKWVSDLYLGTAFVLVPGLSPVEQEARVMWDFVAAATAGVLAGVVFQQYFRRIAAGKQRLPRAVREAVE